MEISITGYYTEPGHRFDVSQKTLLLIRNQIKANVFTNDLLKQIKHKELELYINTNITDNTVKINNQTNIKQNEYLSFTLFLPYLEIVINNKTLVDKFVHYFFEALKHVFALYQYDINTLETVKQNIISEVSTNSKYDFVPDPKTEKWRKAIEKKRKELRNKLL